MKLQKQLSKRTLKRDYYRYVIVIPEEIIQKLKLKEGDELDIKIEDNSVKLTKI